MEKWTPLGTVKSKMAGEELVTTATRTIELWHTIRRTSEIGVEVVFIPSCRFVVAPENIWRERVHRDECKKLSERKLPTKNEILWKGECSRPECVGYRSNWVLVWSNAAASAVVGNDPLLMRAARQLIDLRSMNPVSYERILGTSRKTDIQVHTRTRTRVRTY